jgi:MarR family transcriptional regulator for hemolysin
MPEHPETDFLFALFDLQRLVRQFVDKEASRYGTTRAQWAVLSKLARSEGLKQAELAELMDIQPISLTRLIDRLCDSGLIERRPDPKDRRANRLYLLPAAQPVLKSLAERRAEIMRVALGKMSAAEACHLVAQLDTVKDNIRKAILAQDEKHLEENTNG